MSGPNAADVVGEHLVPVEGVVLEQSAEAGGYESGCGAENASEPGVAIAEGDEGTGLVFIGSDNVRAAG